MSSNDKLNHEGFKEFFQKYFDVNDKNRTLVTDGHKGYLGFVMNHEVVNHNKTISRVNQKTGKEEKFRYKEFKNKNGFTTNNIEADWRRVRNRIRTHYAITDEHLPEYTTKHMFCYNNRKLIEDDDYGAFLKVLKNKIVTYPEFTQIKSRIYWERIKNELSLKDEGLAELKALNEYNLKHNMWTESRGNYLPIN